MPALLEWMEGRLGWGRTGFAPPRMHGRSTLATSTSPDVGVLAPGRERDPLSPTRVELGHARTNCTGYFPGLSQHHFTHLEIWSTRSRARQTSGQSLYSHTSLSPLCEIHDFGI